MRGRGRLKTPVVITDWWDHLQINITLHIAFMTVHINPWDVALELHLDFILYDSPIFNDWINFSYI